MLLEVVWPVALVSSCDGRDQQSTPEISAGTPVLAAGATAAVGVVVEGRMRVNDSLDDGIGDPPAADHWALYASV